MPEVVKLEPKPKTDVAKDIAKTYGDIFRAFMAEGFTQDQAMKLLIQTFVIQHIADDDDE